VIDRIAQTVTDALSAAGLSLDQIAAVGVGAPSPIDSDGGVVIHAPNLAGWRDLPLGRLLGDVLGKPVLVENDVNAGTLGEFTLGAGRGSQDMMGVFLGTGIGGGIILGGRLRAGPRNAAGEIGHMVVAAGGPYCGCGRQGCVEAVASRTAIERDLRAAIAAGRKNLLPLPRGTRPVQFTSTVVSRAFADGCPLTREIIGRAQWYLGLHAASIINLLDPQMLVYGGGLVHSMGEELLAPIRSVAHQHLIRQDGPPVDIVAAQLGDDAGALGAAVFAQQSLVEPAG
jgi:glucokinase